jgi:hypothetical protein
MWLHEGGNHNVCVCFFCYISILFIVQKLACFVSMSFVFWLVIFHDDLKRSSQLHHFLVFIKHASSWHLTFNFFIVFMFNETFFTWTLFTFFFCCFLGMCFFVLQCCEGFVLVSTSDHYFSLSRPCSFCNIDLFLHVLCWQHSSSNFCCFFSMASSSTKHLAIFF